MAERRFKSSPSVLAYRRKYKERYKAKTKAWARTPGGRFYRVSYAAKYRGKKWTLTREQFDRLQKEPCYYCGGSLPKIGNGLDRVDNKRGYEIDNVLPCCTACNRVRGDHFTVEETRVAVQAVLAFRRRSVA